MNPDTTNNEVARLREKVERQAERIRYLEGATNHACGTPLSRANREIDRLKAELARLAPAPEEPVGDWKCPHCGSTTGTWFSRVEPMADICEDCGKAVDEEPVIQENRITEPTIKESLQVEPAPEWRELGEDEVICEVDTYRSDVSLSNWPVSSVMIGKPARNFPEYSFRTRRPLPKPLENETIKKQEEMPLEKELTDLEKGRVVQDFGNGMSISQGPNPDMKAVVSCLRYLRDEIQKLKEAR